jgi:anaerobic magnesium-protoporphyrin IX monomethyl ester cyclase
MRIVLLNPPFKPEYGKFSRASRSPAITKSGTLYYPIWLAYACGALEQQKHEVLLIDSCACQSSLNAVLKRIEEFAPKLVVIDTSTPSIYSDVQCANEIKKLMPQAFICLVGTHPTVLTDEVLNLSASIDAVARHEYDATLVHLAEVLGNESDLSVVDGLSFKQNGKHIHNKIRPYIENLDELPFVSSVYKRHLNINDYFFAAGEFPMVMLMTGRGCPSRCFFCVYPQTFHGHGYRLRSAKNVVDEFEYIVREIPDVKSIGIEDDTFTANQARAREICQLIIDRGLQKEVNWWANARVNLTYETMVMMKQAGCRLIIPGFESGDQEILNNIHKGITLKQSQLFMENAKRAGLLVHGCFMVGNKGETQESMHKTLQLAIELSPDTAQFFPLIPYPGTEAYQWAKENGYLKTLKYDQWLTAEGLHECVLDLPNLKSEALVQFCDAARKKYYLRPKYIFYKFNQCMFSADERKRTLKSLKQFAKFLFK